MKSRIINEKGFSLVELLFVMMMLGVIVLTAIPAFQSFKGQAGDAAAAADLMHIVKTFYSETAEEGVNPWCLLIGETESGRIAPSAGCPDLNLFLSPKIVLDYLLSIPFGNEQIFVMMLHHEGGKYNHLWWDLLGTRQHEKQPRI